MTMCEIADVIEQYAGLERKALEYTLAMKSLVDAAKLPAFESTEWSRLARFIDTEKFERVGNFKEVMSWDVYIAFLDRWARGSDWDCSFRHITASEKRVILELEERSTVSAASSVVNSVSIYEFDDAAMIHHLDIYLQMPVPDPMMLASYEAEA